MRRIVLAAAVAAISLAVSGSPGQAQERKILVGLAAGGSNDIIARELAERLRVQNGDTWWDPLESTCRHASLSIL